ncbi:glycoside hydrolase family 73 protein [Novosphingobium acidiphilum]|uniref:glycoside hydrolase family 73 protein n=1 Tax=Novosphingobium acidiphilum TaxID=505248 RepID=UPI00041D7FAC|nr:glucosaminidase domain-containing protein [Novosphingobium acidiphilum]
MTPTPHPVPDPIVAAARTADRQWHIPASVSLAQWALESGWGAHMPGNNPFGIKAMPGHAVQRFATHESIHGHLVPCEQRFAAFASLDEAFDCHARLLATAPVYHAAFAALPDTRRFVALMAPHYATAPDYAAKILAVIDSAGLDRYDRTDGAAAPG